MRNLLNITAVIEAGTGLCLLGAPGVLVGLLLGAELQGAAAVTVARVAGSALIALALACWLARADGRALVAGMLFYNVAVAAILLHAGLGLALAGIALWPTLILHIGLAGWCATVLWAKSPNAHARSRH